MRLLWWTLAIAGVSLFSIVLSQQRTLDPAQNLTLTIAAPIENGLRDVVDPIAEFFRGVFNRGDLVRENERLRQELERLQADAATSEDAELRLRQLKEALAVKEDRPEDTFVVADVVAQDPSAFKRSLAVNRGSKDGLDEGMVALSKSGSLIGTVSLVYDDFAWLRLLSDANSAVNVTVLSDSAGEDAGARGVAVGEMGSVLSLEMVPMDAKIADGDLVTTSGLGGNYPRALLVGSVKSVEERPQALSIRANIQPAADLSALDTVLIITSFRPARLAGP